MRLKLMCSAQAIGAALYTVWHPSLRRCSAVCGAATGPGLPRWQEVRRLRQRRCIVVCGAQLSGATLKGQQSEFFLKAGQFVN